VPAQNTLTSAGQTTALNQLNDSNRASNIASLPPSYVPPTGLTPAETVFSKDLGIAVLTGLSKLPKTAASRAIRTETTKTIDFFVMNVLSKLHLSSSDLISLKHFMIKDIQKSFKGVTPQQMTTQVVESIISPALQNIVQQGLVSRGYSANSNVVVVAKYWTDLTVSSTIGFREGGPEGAIKAAAEASISAITSMAASTNASLNQNLTSINWNVSVILHDQRKFVQNLQEAMRTKNKVGIARWKQALNIASQSLKTTKSARQYVQYWSNVSWALNATGTAIHNSMNTASTAFSLVENTAISWFSNP
jgi:hypothetical protein